MTEPRLPISASRYLRSSRQQFKNHYCAAGPSGSAVSVLARLGLLLKHERSGGAVVLARGSSRRKTARDVSASWRTLASRPSHLTVVASSSLRKARLPRFPSETTARALPPWPIRPGCHLAPEGSLPLWSHHRIFCCGMSDGSRLAVNSAAGIDTIEFKDEPPRRGVRYGRSEESRLAVNSAPVPTKKPSPRTIWPPATKVTFPPGPRIWKLPAERVVHASKSC